ncbi:MAG: deaminase [Promethearchaeota archaeon]
MKKISHFKNIIKTLKPYSATLIGGSFDPFNQYYFRILKWASEQSRPLIVIVHPDEIVRLRRGFIPPSENHYRRARNIAQLDFVDYVVISKKLAHDPWCLKYLRPKFVIFQSDNSKYLKSLFDLLSSKFPKINFITVPFKRNFQFSVIKPASNFSQNKTANKKLDKIARELILLAKKSKSPIGKISALLVYKDKIIAKTCNSSKGDHAEILLLNKIRPKGDFNNYNLYILIPPCIMCAKAISRSKIKNVYYLYNYGDKLGIEYLKNKGISIKRHKI